MVVSYILLEGLYYEHNLLQYLYFGCCDNYYNVEESVVIISNRCCEIYYYFEFRVSCHYLAGHYVIIISYTFVPTTSNLNFPLVATTRACMWSSKFSNNKNKRHARRSGILLRRLGQSWRERIEYRYQYSSRPKRYKVFGRDRYTFVQYKKDSWWMHVFFLSIFTKV